MTVPPFQRKLPNPLTSDNTEFEILTFLFSACEDFAQTQTFLLPLKSLLS